MGKYIFNIEYRDIEIVAESRDKATLLAFEKIESGKTDADFKVYCSNCKEELDICCCDNCCCGSDDALSEKSQQEKCGDTLTHQHRHGTHPEEGQVSKENDMAAVDNTLSELNEVGDE